MKTQRLDPKKELSRQDGEFSFQDKTNSRSIAGKHTGNIDIVAFIARLVRIF